jgi:hypothetical protein
MPPMSNEHINGQTYTIKIQGRLAGNINLGKTGPVNLTVPLNLSVDGVKSDLSLPELSQLLQQISEKVAPTGLSFTYGPIITSIEKVEGAA